MILEKIITLANSAVKLRFLALERSLRSTGCNLPIWVIPYDNNLFDLPPNSHWWKIEEIDNWLENHGAHKMMKKYQCLTTSNYQFVDSDVVFLRNPEEVLAPHSGFITSCSHWNNPNHTFTSESVKFLRKKTSLWEKNIFNAGQFACDVPLYSFETLKKTSELSEFIYTCLKFPYHDQPGLNLLVNSTNVKIYNLTLPPLCMESTWAGSYYQVAGEIDEIDHETFWKDEEKKPYLIHWAGCEMFHNYKIDTEFTKYLRGEEISLWKAYLNKQKDKTKKMKSNLSYKLRGIKRLIKLALNK